MRAQLSHVVWQGKLLFDLFSLDDLLFSDFKELEQLFALTLDLFLLSSRVDSFRDVVVGRLVSCFLGFLLLFLCFLSFLDDGKMCSQLLSQACIVLLNLVSQDR